MRPIAAHMLRRLERTLRWWLLERPRYRLRKRLYQAFVDVVGPAPRRPLPPDEPIPQWRFVALDIALTLFPKANRDCRAHHWYATLDERWERCTYCNVGVRAAPPEPEAWRLAVECAAQLMEDDDEFDLLVHRVRHAAGSPRPGPGAEALVLATWLVYAEGVAR